MVCREGPRAECSFLGGKGPASHVLVLWKGRRAHFVDLGGEAGRRLPNSGDRALNPLSTGCGIGSVMATWDFP